MDLKKPLSLSRQILYNTRIEILTQLDPNSLGQWNHAIKIRRIKTEKKLVWYLDTEDTMAAEKREPKEENRRRRRMMDQNH